MNSNHRKTDDSPCFRQLNEVLAHFGMTEESERDKVKSFCSRQSFAKDAMLYRCGEIADSVFFICSGLVRFYYITEDGKQHNKSFSRENQFAGAMQYSVRPQPSRFYIQALEPTQTLAISLQGLNTLYLQSLPWANVGRFYMEALAVRKTDREASFLLDSAEQRYKDFLTQEPELVERLPLYHIASFLGITDVALSRIRRRINT